MVNTYSNREIICQTLLEEAKDNKDLLVLCSDSRGSSSMTPFFNTYPKQSIEVGIAEQNLVGIAAGLASCQKKVFVFSPASFLTTRSYEQIKVDVSYSNTDVKLVGISGGISYGALGMTHFSLQDIACLTSLSNMRVFLPCDAVETKAVIRLLCKDTLPAYIRVSRKASEIIYSEDETFEIGKIKWHGKPSNVVLLACGEMVAIALEVKKKLQSMNIDCFVGDVFSLKPIDKDDLLSNCQQARLVVTLEEHTSFGGLHAIVSQLLSQYCPKRVLRFSLPDTSLVSGEEKDVFNYYHLDKESLVTEIRRYLSS